MRIKIKYKEKIKSLVKEIEQLVDEKNDLELKINEVIQSQEVVKGLYQKEIVMMKGQRLEAERKANENYETMQKIIARKNEIITNLKNEIEEIKKENAEEISRITEDTNRSLQELKAIYHKEKPKAPVDSEAMENLKSELNYLKDTLKSFEISENTLKEQISSKDNYIEKLNRKLRIKASESTKQTQPKCLSELTDSFHEQLIEKDIEITKLKKIIGELRLDLATNTTKPPIHSPKSYRSMTFINKLESTSTESFFMEKNEEFLGLKKYERIFFKAFSIQCEKCLKKFKKNEFLEHLEVCEGDERTEIVFEDEDEKVEELKKSVEKLKLGLASMKSQRDKAKIEAERLLGQLKQVKVELAVCEEEVEERVMDIKEEYRGMVEVVLKVWKEGRLADQLKNEIERVVRKSDKFFRGRLSKSFAN